MIEALSYREGTRRFAFRRWGFQVEEKPQPNDGEADPTGNTQPSGAGSSKIIPERFHQNTTDSMKGDPYEEKIALLPEYPAVSRFKKKKNR